MLNVRVTANRVAGAAALALAVVYLFLDQLVPAPLKLASNQPPPDQDTSSPLNLSGDIGRFLAYAPVVYLDEHETYFPSSLENFLARVTPYFQHKPIQSLRDKPLSLDNLSMLNSFGDGGVGVFLTSLDDPSKYPAWLHDSPPKKGKSSAAVPIIFVKKELKDEHGEAVEVVDMFSFYFFNFNAGPRVPGDSLVFFGDHVGDLEHSVVRFENGKPKTAYLSRHGSGSLYLYKILQKEQNRLVLFAGRGTHALYGISGQHEYIMHDKPATSIVDYTSRGIYWDPLLNPLIYSFSTETQHVTPIYPIDIPTSWFDFRGNWGDQKYESRDPRQGIVCGQVKWGDGPTFPIAKNLNRIEACENENLCVIEPSLSQLFKRPWGF